MRYPGEIRQVLRAVFSEVGPTTWRDAAAAGQVGFDAARRTVENMVQAGELVRCGVAKPEGSRVWHGVYELQEPQPALPDTTAENAGRSSLEELAAVTATWANFE